MTRFICDHFLEFSTNSQTDPLLLLVIIVANHFNNELYSSFI